MILSETFQSSSSSAVYKTQFDTETGKGTCTCPGWTKRAVRECKHTKLLAADDRAGGAAGLAAKMEPKPALVPDPFQGFREAPTVKPMLASAMKADQSLDDFTNDEWVMEEKYDGHRLLLMVQKVKLYTPFDHLPLVTGWSRPGHDRPSAQRTLPKHILKAAQKLPSGIYDGELHIPGGTSSDVVRLDLQDKLVLTLFDAVEIMGTSIVNTPLNERRAMLEVAVSHVQASDAVRIAQQVPVSLKTVKTIWREGGEGAIIKRKSSTYKSGWRTPDWIKVKQISADELTITGFEEGKMGPQSIFKLKHDDGRETSVKIITNDLLRAVAKNPKSYIGRRVTISYMGLTTSGLWRHPVLDHLVDG